MVMPHLDIVVPTALAVGAMIHLFIVMILLEFKQFLLHNY